MRSVGGGYVMTCLAVRLLFSFRLSVCISLHVCLSVCLSCFYDCLSVCLCLFVCLFFVCLSRLVRLCFVLFVRGEEGLHGMRAHVDGGNA